jgi:hypothetical protein
MHISTWLRLADLDDAELRPEDRKELMQAAAVVKQLLFARNVSPGDAAYEMARVCGLSGIEIERWRQEQDETMATVMVGFRRGAPDTITLTDGSEHKVEHEKLGDLYDRLAQRHGVKPRTIKDWCRKHLRRYTF